ncbi:MAG: hypothetical protein JW749_00965 [Sedimentisphaerales bacterium]|nr:hypothetical protein [Sedimentisphaerales bacterium]
MPVIQSKDLKAIVTAAMSFCLLFGSTKAVKGDWKSDANDNESVYSGEVSATPGYQTCPEVINAGLALLSDLNGECYVDELDLWMVTDYWLETNCAGLTITRAAILSRTETLTLPILPTLPYCGWSAMTPKIPTARRTGNNK